MGSAGVGIGCAGREILIDDVADQMPSKQMGLLNAGGFAGGNLQALIAQRGEFVPIGSRESDGGGATISQNENPCDFLIMGSILSAPSINAEIRINQSSFSYFLRNP